MSLPFKIPGMSKNSSTQIYLDGTSLKMTLTRRKGSKNVVEKVYCRNIAGVEEAALVDEVQAGLRAIGTTTPTVSVLLSSRFAITKTIEVPSFDAAEIDSIVQLQAGRHTPYSREEITVGYQILEEVEDKYTKVLLTIISNESIKAQIESLISAGLEVSDVRIDFDLIAQGIAKVGVVPSSEITAVLHLDKTYSDYIVLSNGNPFFVRSIPIGYEHICGQEMVDDLVQEIVKSQETFSAAEPKHPVKKVLILGPEHEGVKKLSSLVNEKLALPSEVLQVTEVVHMSDNALSESADSEAIPINNALLGASVPDITNSMNFLPDEMKTTYNFKEKAQQVFTSGALSLVVFVLVLGIFMIKVQLQSNYIDSLDKKFAAKETEAKKLYILSEHNRLIRNFETNKGISLRALTELEKIMPRDMMLNEMDLNKEGKVMIKGNSKVMSRVFAFVTEFENTKVFGGVTTDYAKSRKVDGKDITDFGLSANLEELA